MSPLERVQQARWERRESQDAYVAAVQAAKDSGETVTAIAEAAGVSRPTIYKMLRNDQIAPYYESE